MFLVLFNNHFAVGAGPGLHAHVVERVCCNEESNEKSSQGVKHSEWQIFFIFFMSLSACSCPCHHSIQQLIHCLVAFTHSHMEALLLLFSPPPSHTFQLICRTSRQEIDLRTTFACTRHELMVEGGWNIIKGNKSSLHPPCLSVSWLRQTVTIVKCHFAFFEDSAVAVTFKVDWALTELLD